MLPRNHKQLTTICAKFEDDGNNCDKMFLTVFLSTSFLESIDSSFSDITVPSDCDLWCPFGNTKSSSCSVEFQNTTHYCKQKN